MRTTIISFFFQLRPHGIILITHGGRELATYPLPGDCGAAAATEVSCWPRPPARLPRVPSMAAAPCSPYLADHAMVVGVNVSGGRHHHRDNRDQPIYASINIRPFYAEELHNGQRRLGRLLMLCFMECNYFFV